MEKHIPLDNTIKDLDDIMSRVNGLEVSSTDEYQKAIDLVTLEMFKIKNKK